MKKHVSMNVVAYVAGVSIATVSRCINTPEQVARETRRKVEMAIRETGYTPNALARNFRRGRSHLILVAVPSVGDPFFSTVMRGVRGVANERGYTVFIRETREEALSTRAINAILNSKQADGLVLLNNMTYVHRKLDPATDPFSRPPTIHVDNVAASEEITRHLIELGHRRIAMIYGSTKPSFVDRERGFLKAMQGAGLVVEPELVVDAENTLDGARAAVRDLLGLAEAPSAILCASDEMALGCMHELREAGLQVPADVSVAGFDDTRYAAVSNPPLTTIRQPAEDMGAYLVEELCRAIDGEAGQGENAIVVPHELVIRESVARRA